MIADGHSEGEPRAAESFGSLLDRRPWGGYQMLILALASIAVLFDGFDNQALGFALPSLMREWGLPKQAFAPALAVSQLGMLFGTLIGGWLGDRHGRKPALVGAVLLFGTATIAIPAIGSVAALAALRLLAGMGLGATFPNVAALTAEYTPRRFRSLAVSISIVCVPLGGVLGGFVAATVLPVQGWRGLFLAAGIATLAISILLALGLPETLDFLVRTPRGRRRAQRVLARMNIDLASEVLALPQMAENEADPGGFWSYHRRDTLALWAAFFFGLTAIYAAFGWLPTLLSEQGFDLAVSSRGLAYFNLGGVGAALATGWMMGRFGSRWPMVLLAGAAIVTATVIMLVPVLTVRLPWLYIALFVEGGCINGVQTTLYALASHLYPSRLRAFGVGAATAAGRSGAIASSYLGGIVIALGGAAAFHGLLAFCLLLVVVSLLAIRRHQRPEQPA